MPDPISHAPSSAATLWPARLLIAVALLLTLFRLCGSDFTWWDDHLTIHQNALLNPPTLKSLAFYWTEPTLGLYVPITYTVWAVLAKLAYVRYPVDDAIFLNPWFFHTANVLVHLVSTWLAFGILRRLFRRIDAALIGALFFGLHPLQVETIGWISGMKDLLCWMFSLSAILLYVRRVQNLNATTPSAWRSWELPGCILLLVLAVLSKPTAIVIPAAMLAIDVLLMRKTIVRPLLELLPMFTISAGGAVIARVAQYVDTIKPAPLWQRPFIIGDNTAFYLGKVIWPRDLAIDYSRTINNVTADSAIYWHWILPALLGITAVASIRRRPAFAAGAAVFMIGFSPVSGIATFQMQHISLTTDHYLYFSLFGLALILADLVSRAPKKLSYTLAAIVLAALAVRSYRQTAMWTDSFSLYEHTIAANPNSSVARNNLASAYMNATPPRYPEAEALLESAMSLNADLDLVYSNLAMVKAALGKRDEALKNYLIAWKGYEAKKAPPHALAELASAISRSMLSLNDLPTARQYAEQAVELDPKSTKYRQLLAQIALVEEQARLNPTLIPPPNVPTTTPTATTSPSLPPASPPSR